MNDSDSEHEQGLEIPEKRNPGRPKKQVIKKVVAKEGIVQLPMNFALKDTQSSLVNAIEVVYDNPVIFKKIFHLFKVMGVETIRILFDKELIKMYGLDHLKKSSIYVKIFGSRINRYYCEEPLEIGCNTIKANEIMSTLNKDHGQIIIATNRQYKRSKITLILANDPLEEDGVDNIEIDTVEPYDWQIERDLEKEAYYPIKFTVSSKYFKRKISDFNKSCDILRIEKNGHELLNFSYNHSDKRGDHHTYFKNPGKINLISMIEEDEIFSTSVFLEYIKLFSSSLIADDIQISADKENDLIFTAVLDQDEKDNKNNKQKKYKIADTERCVIKVITEIVKSRV
jgi:hypothetical protein